ncbi:MAG TPA: prolipoprotein diacylglyceryl transferase [Pseudolysinimonas sp.]|nr:prolipoprotein diacylglyceryl transferase [Pseudolysinimonas sp.]
MIAAPFSIPSPPPEWSQFDIPVGWLHAVLPFVSADQVLTIHAYALCLLAGIIVALFITNQRLTKRGAEPWIIIDVSLWGIATGIIGARLWHVFTHPDDYFGPGKNLWEIANIPAGGLAIFGTLLGGAVGFFIGCRITGLRFLSVADAVAPALLIAQGLGRFGNYFNQELFGLPTDAWYGLQIDRPNSAIPTGIADDVLFQPTFLYEMIWNVIGALIIVFLIENTVKVVKSSSWSEYWPAFAKKRYLGVVNDQSRLFSTLGLPSIRLTRRANWQWGKTFGLYLIWYGMGRTWFESIRLDPSETFLGIRSNVWGALAAILLGIVIIAVQTRRHPGVEPSPYRLGREWKDPATVDSEDTYSDTDDASDDAALVPATSGATRSS